MINRQAATCSTETPGRRSHGHYDASAGPDGFGSPRSNRSGVARNRGGRGGDRYLSRDGAVRVRWSDVLSPAPNGGGAARHPPAGVSSSEILFRTRHQGGAPPLPD